MIHFTKILFFVCALVCAATSINAQTVDEGSCGENLTWTLTDEPGNLTLTITGSGAMYDYSLGTAPWYSHSRQMETLILSDEITHIGNYAFYDCGGFTGALTLPAGITSIGSYAFSSCFGFTGALTLPAGITSIEDGAFSSCTGFTGALTLPEGLASIGNYAFVDCFGFTGNLTLPEDLVSIGTSAFSGCSGFTGDLTLPEGLASIEYRAFAYCSGFTGALTIPASLAFIGPGAFEGCTGFSEITNHRADPQSIGTDVFRYVPKTIPLFVPQASIQAYREATGWQEFNVYAIIEILTQPEAETHVARGKIAGSLTVTANDEESNPFDYQWYTNTTPDNSGGTLIEGETSPSFDIPAGLAQGTYYYYCTVKGRSSTPVVSDVAKVVVIVEVENITLPSAELITGTSLTLAGTVEPDDASYQTIVWSLVDAGTTGASLNGDVLTAGAPGTARVRATVANGLVNGDYTQEFDIEVRDRVDAATPVITGQPQSAGYTQGDSAAPLSVTAEVSDGGVLSYQWYSNTHADNETGTPIADATEASYTPSTAEAGTIYYYVVVTNTNTSVDGTQTASIASDAVSVTVSPVTSVNEVKAANTLQAWVSHGVVHVSGLIAGEPWYIYASSGRMIYQATASGNESTYALPQPGVYVVRQGERKIKIKN